MADTPCAAIIALRIPNCNDSTGRSVHRRPAAAFLILLPGAAGTQVIPPDLGRIAPWFTRAGTWTDLTMLPEILVSAQQPSRHVDRKSTRLNSSHLGISYA